MPTSPGEAFGRIGKAFGGAMTARAKGELETLKFQKEQDEAKAKKLQPNAIFQSAISSVMQLQQSGAPPEEVAEAMSLVDKLGPTMEVMKFYMAAVQKNKELDPSFQVAATKMAKIDLMSFAGDLKGFPEMEKESTIFTRAGEAVKEEEFGKLLSMSDEERETKADIFLDSAEFNKRWDTHPTTRNLPETYKPIFKRKFKILLLDKDITKKELLGADFSLPVEWGKVGGKGMSRFRPKFETRTKKLRGGKPRSSSLKGREGTMLGNKTESKKQKISAQDRAALKWYKSTKLSEPGHPSLKAMEAELRGKGLL